MAASLLISLASGPCTLDRARVRTWAALFRKYGIALVLLPGRDEGPWAFAAVETKLGFLNRFLDRAASGTLPKCSRCVLRVDQVPAERVIVMAKAGGDLDVTQLMTAREVMDHVLACAAVHLSWLEALPQAYLFNVEDGAHTDANAIDELLATQIPLEVENQEVEVGLLPVALDGAGPQNALESALARFPVVTSEEREAPSGSFVDVVLSLCGESDSPLKSTQRFCQAKAYKVVLCHYFESGWCRNGDRCTYAHGPEELRLPSKAEARIGLC